MATDGGEKKERKERMQDFDVASIAAIASKLKELAGRYESLHKILTDSNYSGLLTADGGAQVYTLLRVSVDIEARLRASFDKETMPKPLEMKTTNNDDDLSGTNGPYKKGRK